MPRYSKYVDEKVRTAKNGIWMNDIQTMQNLYMIFEYFGLNKNFNHIEFQKIMSQDNLCDDDCILTFFLAITRLHPNWEELYEQVEKEIPKRMVV